MGFELVRLRLTGMTLIYCGNRIPGNKVVGGMQNFSIHRTKGLGLTVLQLGSEGAFEVQNQWVPFVPLVNREWRSGEEDGN